MNKGFTLVELLAVIFLLATISLIVTVVVFAILNNSRETLYEEQVAQIENAAKNYQLATPTLADNTSVSLETLADAGFLDSSNLIDPRDRSKLCGQVQITYENNQYYFNFEEEEC